jgi:hypothetical protein
MAPPLAVVLLPGPGAFAATLTSVCSEVGDEVPVLFLATQDHSPEDLAGVASGTPDEVLAAADILAFARAGDRWRTGALSARLRPLNAHPTAVLGVAGHVVVDGGGREVLAVQAPMPPVDATELLLHPSIEPAAVLVRSTALDEAALELIARPHGDAVVWSEIVRRHSLLPSMEIAAEVALDENRHGHEPRARTEALLTAIRAGKDSGAPGGSTLRRELLRRLYIEPLLDPELTGIDLAALFAIDATAPFAAVLEDLQWILERQHDALTVERLRWVHGEIDPLDRIPETTEVEIQDARLKAEELWNELKVRNAELARLQAEIKRRDATIDRLATAGQIA